MSSCQLKSFSFAIFTCLFTTSLTQLVSYYSSLIEQKYAEPSSLIMGKAVKDITQFKLALPGEIINKALQIFRPFVGCVSHSGRVSWYEHMILQKSDMEKGADARTLSAEVFENCGNFWIVEEYLLLLLREIYRW